jgi:hypothetical protein
MQSVFALVMDLCRFHFVSIKISLRKLGKKQIVVVCKSGAAVERQSEFDYAVRPKMPREIITLQVGQCGNQSTF